LENVLKLRDQFNKPLWLGESGENSNTWFADCISLVEKHQIGWSWWPVKKSKFNNVLKVIIDNNYYHLIESWANNTPLNADETFNAVMQYAENHKIENCEVAEDVIYAMLGQTNVYDTKPFKKLTTNTSIWFADYDMGREGYAYHDTLSADYHIDSGGSWTDWNNGGFYRNDGVDIGDDHGMPYVGWTDEGEWIRYTVDIPNSGKYKLEIHSASKKRSGIIDIEVNDKLIKENLVLPLTSNNTDWQTSKIENIYLPKGKINFRIIFKKGGSNLFKFKIVSQ